MEDLTGFATGNQLTAAEFVQPMEEIQGVFEKYNIIPSAGDLAQLNQALANKAASGDWYNDTGTSSAYQLDNISVNEQPTQMVEGMRVRFVPSTNNTTGILTAQVGALGAFNLTTTFTGGGVSFDSADFSTEYPLELIFTGTAWLVNSTRLSIGPANNLSIRVGASSQALASLNAKVEDWQTGDTGDVATGIYLADGDSVYDALDTLKGETCQLIKTTANQSIPDAAAETFIIFDDDDVLIDTDSYFDENTSTTNFAINTGKTVDTSYFTITASVTFAANATGIREIAIVLENSGSTIIEFGNSGPGDGSRTTTLTVSTGKIRRNDAGYTALTQVKIRVFQNSGGVLDIIGGFTGTGTNPNAASIYIEMHNRGIDI